MRKYMFAVAIAVVASLLIVTVSMNTRSLPVQPEDIENAVPVLSTVELVANNAVIDESYRFEVQDLDAQLYITGIEGEAEALVITFAEPLPEGTVSQLYYSKDGEYISEMHSVISHVWEDTKSMVVRLPERREYALFRLDIDKDYQIEDLAVIREISAHGSQTALTAMLQGREPFPFFQLILCFLVLLAEGLLIAWKIDAIKEWFSRTCYRIRDNRKVVLKGVGTCLGGSILGSLVWFILLKMGVAHSSTVFSVLSFLVIGFAIGAMISIRHQLGPHPEYGFLVIALCIGLLFAVLEPPKTLITWDDEIHYGHEVALSYGDSHICTEPEQMLISRSIDASIDLEGRYYCAQNLNPLNDNKIVSLNNVYSPVPWNTIGSYLAPAGAMWLARLLNMSFSKTVIAARMANLLCYAIVVLIAIKQLKYGRLLVSCLCLNPTVLFLAGNFSYDPFCISLTLLGLCIWLGVYQTEGAQMTPTKAMAMLLSFLFGLLVKQVYFPVVMVVLFLPKDKFRSKVEAQRYRVAVLSVVLVLVASFIIPLFSGDGTYSDTRGGDGVDAVGQVSYILHNPGSYLKVLTDFLLEDYFSLTNLLSITRGCIRSFGYISIYGGLTFPEVLVCFYLALIIAAWFGSTDGHETGERPLPGWLKSLGFILTFGTICIVATSFYCAFTPVGATTILGCQSRYMIPVVFVMIVITRPTFLKNTISQQKFNAAILFSTAAIMITGTLQWVQLFL